MIEMTRSLALVALLSLSATAVEPKTPAFEKQVAEGAAAATKAKGEAAVSANVQALKAFIQEVKEKGAKLVPLIKEEMTNSVGRAANTSARSLKDGGEYERGLMISLTAVGEAKLTLKDAEQEIISLAALRDHYDAEYKKALNSAQQGAIISGQEPDLKEAEGFRKELAAAYNGLLTHNIRAFALRQTLKDWGAKTYTPVENVDFKWKKWEQAHGWP